MEGRSRRRSLSKPTAGSRRPRRVSDPAATVRRLLLVVALPGASACASEDRAPATQRFGYSASHPAPGGGSATIRLSGAVVFESASDDQLEGRWDVDQLSPEFGLGEWQEDAYVVYAYPTYGGTLVHRIRRIGGPEELACEGHYTLVVAGGSEQRVPLTCSIEPVPPVGVPPEIPPPATDMVVPPDSPSTPLPASADTLGDAP